MESIDVEQFAALAHPSRLALFRLLMRRYPDAVPAGEIAQVLGLLPNTASAHLANLTRAGLIAPHRKGRSLHYRAELDAVRGLVDDLLIDCCRDRPDLCPAPAPSRPPHRVLFLCRANSARSIMAEVILRDTSRLDALSAGIAPGEAVHPDTLSLLHAHGHMTEGLRPKGLADLPELPTDLVLTVCDDAANVGTRPLPGRPVMAHWGLPDPVGAREGRRAFEETYRRLQARIRALTALPLDRISRTELQQAVDAIGRGELTS
jgi:protein-tyrosine-phosphatase/DNA-binding transcriptional ArsR family regulator